MSHVKCFYYLFNSTIKVDCITVTTLPVKAVIDDHIQQLFDALLNSLRRSISTDTQLIDGFLNEAFDSLSVRPQTVEEIKQVNLAHKQLSDKEPEVNKGSFFDLLNFKNWFHFFILTKCCILPKMKLVLSFSFCSRFILFSKKLIKRTDFYDLWLEVVWNS